MSIVRGIVGCSISSEDAVALNPASFTANPSSLSLGTSSSGFIDVTSDRVTGFTVSLTGTAASVATVTTAVGDDTGGCNATDACRVTVSVSGGTPGASYSGNIVLTDESGNATNVSLSLSISNVLSMIAQSQNAKYIWAMDTAGTSQPNLGDGGTLALTLTTARASSAQQGTEGRFPLTDAVNERASATVTATADMSIVVCVNLTEITATRAIFGGNSFNNNANPGYIAINASGALAYQKYDLSGGVVIEASPTTGVWLLCITIDSSGSLNAYARKVGGSLLSQTYSRGSAVDSSDSYILGGNGSNYFSAPGDYYFFAIYDTVIGTTEFNALYASIG